MKQGPPLLGCTHTHTHTLNHPQLPDTGTGHRARLSELQDPWTDRSPPSTPTRHRKREGRKPESPDMSQELGHSSMPPEAGPKKSWGRNAALQSCWRLPAQLGHLRLVLFPCPAMGRVGPGTIPALLPHPHPGPARQPAVLTTEAVLTIPSPHPIP